MAWDDERMFQLKDDMCEWITQKYLDEKSIIYQLFVQAGVTSKRSMASHMLVWHIYDWNIEHKLEKTQPKR